MAAIHLTVFGQDPIEEGRFGCDYRWLANYAAYQPLPHRWSPGTDSAYARYQAQDIAEDEDSEHEMCAVCGVNPGVGGHSGPDGEPRCVQCWTEIAINA